MRILIVDDEIHLTEAITALFKAENYHVDAVHDGESGYDYAMSGLYDVIVLDAMLPKMDGFDVLKKLRTSGNNTPVLMLTAKEDITDKVRGLDFGADDYMTKPFNNEEFLARIRAISRRQGEVVMDELKYYDITVNMTNYTLNCNGKSIKLGPREMEFMKILMSKPEIIVPKEEIIVKIWGTESDAEDNNVEVYISFLRKKLRHIESKVKIQTVRKVGYKLGVDTAC